MSSSKLEEIGELIRTQDNRCTSDPMFLVQQRKRYYGMDPMWCDDYAWVNAGGDYDEADEDQTAKLDEMDEFGEDTGDWYKSYYMDTWEFVTACFTEKACEDYIEANSHRLTDPRIYAASAYRNWEFITVREALRDGKLKACCEQEANS